METQGIKISMAKAGIYWATYCPIPKAVRWVKAKVTGNNLYNF